MKNFLFLAVIVLSGSVLKAQQVDSIFLNLYTDSLKKGQHNYINVDGKLSNGKWMPLSSKEIEFSCATAKFQGNELIIPEGFNDSSVTIKAVLRSNPSVHLERTIWIRQKPDPLLPTSREIMNRGRRS
jgi:hypothetical protein